VGKTHAEARCRLAAKQNRLEAAWDIFCQFISPRKAGTLVQPCQNAVSKILLPRCCASTDAPLYVFIYALLYATERILSIDFPLSERANDNTARFEPWAAGEDI